MAALDARLHSVEVGRVPTRSGMTGDVRAGSTTDRWLLWPPVVAVAAAAIVLLLGSLPGAFGFVLTLLAMAGGVVFALTVCVAVPFLLFRQRPRKAVSVALALLMPILLRGSLEGSAEYLHLGLTAGFGIGQLGPALRSSDGRFASHDWSIGLAGGPSTFLIYNATDGVADTPARREGPTSTDGVLQPECAGKVRRLLAHYYVCTF